MKMKPLLTYLKSQVKFLLYAAFLTLFTCASSLAQEHKVTGTVRSAVDNSPMPGVNVLIQGTTTGKTTDVGGNYSISVPNNNSVLVFSFISYTSQQIPVGDKTVIDVMLVSASTQLGEIVVTAFGIQKEKKALTYAAQNVATADVVQARELNVANALSGKVAGIDIIKSNSGVGSPTRVVLRGNRSISGNNQPLYVVDGSPINNDASTPDTENGGVAGGDGISNINPEDIESITVLKGPSATALYGTRANNGAIIIVTKKGAPRKGLGVEYSLNYSVETPVILTKMQNVYGQGSAGSYFKGSEFDWGAKMDGTQVAHWTPNVNSPNYGTTYPYVAHPNNEKDFFQLGTNMSNSLGLTAGSETLQAYFSATNTHSTGIIPGNNLDRNNFNLRVSGKLGKVLNFDSKITYFHQQVNNPVSTGDDFANPMRAILRQPSNISNDQAKDYQYYDNSGALLQNYWNPHSNGGENPYWLINRIPRADTRDRVLSVNSLKYDIATGLSLMVRTSIDFIYDNSISRRYNDTYTIADRGKYYVSNSNNSEMNNDFLLNYNHNITPDFSLNVSGGGNMLIQKSYYLNTDNGDLLKPDLFTVANASALIANEGGATKKLNSLYAFATLGYKNYLFLDITGRNDWSSTLPSTSWSYFYPSVGLTWVASDMIKSLPGWFTFAKLRASIAQVGNDTDPYRLDPIYNFGTGGALGFATRNGTQPAANLKPELTTSKELGMDIRFFRNKVGLDFTWYRSNSKNQLLTVPLPSPSGYDNQFINAGNIQNTGWEGTLNLKPLDGQLTWDIAFNFSHNKSLVVSLSEGLTSYVIRGRSWMTTVKVVEGHEFGDIYTRGFLRNAAGDVLVNGSTGLPLLTPGQSLPMGNYNPNMLAGMRNSFTYKEFDFSFLIDARFGGDVFSFTEANLASDGFSDYTLQGREGFVVKGVVQTLDASGNVVSETPNTQSVTSEAYWQILGGRNTPVGEVFKYDGTNVRVREALLGYTKALPNFFIKNVRIGIFGQNLFFIVNKAKRLDPNLMVGNTNIQGTEGFGLPGTRTIGMNLKLTF
jgi:TonB-linked SusC/RagA family outer membrane protein